MTEGSVTLVRNKSLNEDEASMSIQISSPGICGSVLFSGQRIRMTS